jgi:glucan 1,3-beta-glucosidase
VANIRGVNIGNWLVLERWMKPELFEGLKAPDETAFCDELGDNAFERLKAHRDTYITYEDFKWIAEAGLNTVRIPVPHWIFGDVKSYYGCIQYLDKAMEWAEKTGLKVLIDLHTAPGCQNGFDNGGIAGVCEWHTKKEYVDKTVQVVDQLAERYKNQTAVWGFQLLNEPRWDVPMEVLRDYYKRGYEAVRKHMDEKVAVVFHDGFRLMEWKDFMREPQYKNVILDTHFYQCFTEEDRNLDAASHIQYAAVKRAEEIKEMSAYFPVIIGEWSLGIDPTKTLTDLNELQLNAVNRAYAAAQLLSYETAEGWFFWSYKLENDDMPTWDYRKSVLKGWLPLI